MITNFKVFENNMEYKVGDNITILTPTDDKYNGKIIRLKYDDLYSYVIMVIPFRDIISLPKSFDKYGNIVYYIRNSHIVGKITDETISNKIDAEYEKKMIEGESKKYNL